MKIDCFTSITSNYIPKARVLAASLKAQHPDWGFHIVLSDDAPTGSWLDTASIDTVIPASVLPIPRFRPWAFGHSLVELCTAVKGPALLDVARRASSDVVIYFDPDIVVTGRLDQLVDRLDGAASVLLTPHLTAPERDRRGIEDNEIAALKHGVYNLGFVAVRMDSRGRGFADWWSQRLLNYCEDFIPGGLFTDQRWVDLAPALFDGVHVERSTRYNVATWNVSNRRVEGRVPDAMLVNGEPMGFYHFSGLDKGDCAVMLEVYGAHSPVLREFLAWYLGRCDEEGQQQLGSVPWAWRNFADGTPIQREHRALYRLRPDLQAAFADPYATGQDSYLAWYRVNGATEASSTPALVMRTALGGDVSSGAEALRELELIKRSRAYRLAGALSSVYRVFAGRG